MKLFKNILFVTEETVVQVSALDRAVSLAENNHAKLTVIDVVPPVADVHRADIMTYHRNAVASLIKPFHNRIQIQTDIVVGTTFLEAIRAVLRNGHDLVIKAAENPAFMKRLFGSDDMHLLRKCPCPVWLMKPPEKPNYRCILAAVDFEPLQLSPSAQSLNEEILQLAASLALQDAATLHLVHAWETFGEKAMLAKGDTSKESIAAYVEKQHLQHKKGLYMLGGALRDRIGADAYDRLSPRFHLPQGSAKKMIASLAEELEADMVVMGTVARTGISGLIIGNTAEAIFDQLSCSVLAVKPPGFKTPVTLV